MKELIITSVVTIVVAIISSGALNTYMTLKQAEKHKDDSSKKAARLMMYFWIKHLCKQYVSDGEIHQDDLEDLIDMHKCYHDDLGGNGFLDEMMNRVMQLKIV